jgi:VWFA-related protein
VRALASAFVVLALTPAAFAEAPAPKAAAAAQAPRASASVKIDFRALTEEGQPVTDLKPDELTLKVNGKPRQIQSLGIFHTAAADPSPGGSALPPPYATNAVGRNGRVIHVLVDDDSIAPGREAQVREAMRLLASEMAPGDQLGVLTTQGQLNFRPSSDLDRVQRAVNTLVGRSGVTESDSEAQCRTTRVLSALGSMLALTGGTPTTIVVFSAGLTPPAQKIIDMTKRSAPTSAQVSAATNDVCPVRPEDFENTGMLAAAARADLYLFHVTEGMVNRSTTQDAGFESLAGVTGAEFVRLTSSPQAGVSRLLRETASYYTAAFEPDASERNGGTFRVELKTTRDKVKVRTRPSVDIGKEVVRAAVSPKDMLRTQTPYSDLPLRAAGHTSRTAGSDDVKIVALFEALDPAIAIKEASIGLFDEKNTLKKQWTAQPADLARRPVMAALAAAPGTYRVRVAALDAAGRAGTTDYELKVEVPRADPLKLSTLVLGTQQQGGGFVPRLDFGTEPVAIGLLEIYGVPKGGTVTVDLDVVSTPEGTALATAQTTVNPGSADDMRVAFGGFSIASLPAGDYLMRAVVSLDGKPVGKVVRTLRKS